MRGGLIRLLRAVQAPRLARAGAATGVALQLRLLLQRRGLHLRHRQVPPGSLRAHILLLLQAELLQVAGHVLARQALHIHQLRTGVAGSQQQGQSAEPRLITYPVPCMQTCQRWV